MMIESETIDAESTANAAGMRANQGNRLLEQFPAAERARINEHSEVVSLKTGDVICDPGKPNDNVYFPDSGILSSVIVLAGNVVVETAVIGNEGIAGIPAIFNLPVAPTRIVQRMAGQARRANASEVRAVLAESPECRGIVARYALTLFQQCAQNAACNLHHRLESRICRWLAATADRASATEFYLTQDFLSEMLGVSRQSINTATGVLQRRGMIIHRRGLIGITDRDRLEATACECYQATRHAFQQLMQSEKGM